MWKGLSFVAIGSGITTLILGNKPEFCQNSTSMLVNGLLLIVGGAALFTADKFINKWFFEKDNDTTMSEEE